MFDIGFWELLIIGAVALLVVGPDRLPGLATFIGQWVGRARRYTNHVRNEIQQELEAEHLKSLVNEQKQELQSLRREVADVRDETEASAREIETAARDGAVARDDRTKPAASGAEGETATPAGNGTSGAPDETREATGGDEPGTGETDVAEGDAETSRRTRTKKSR